jgi:hypothetical protein
VLGLLWFIVVILVLPFRSVARLQAENAVLRQQLIILRRKCRGRVRVTSGERLFFVQLYRWFPSILQVLEIIRPETLAMEVSGKGRAAADRRGSTGADPRDER